jgi:multiple sugar transport system ATP-binding protein
VREAGVFLFDEPLSNLDAKLRAELRRELKLLHQTLQSTMIYVTHDQVEAMTLATRIVVMRAGKVQQIGAPAEVYERPANLFVAGFLGSPSMNFIDGRLDGAGRFLSPVLSLDLPAGGGWQLVTDAVLGVRPEHIQISEDGTFAGTVALTEPMGNHQVVWIAVGERKLSAIVNDARSFAAGQAVRFSVDAARASLFDKTSELRLAAT